MNYCCSHLLFTREGKKRKPKKFRVPNSEATAKKVAETAASRNKKKHKAKAARLVEEKAQAAKVVDPSRPFMCPAVGCTERYGTRERCERHILVCASATAYSRGDRELLQQFEPLVLAVDSAADENGESSAANTVSVSAGGQNIISSSSSRQTDHATEQIAPESKSSEEATIQKEDFAKQLDAKASMPFMCPAHGCGERYETRESCERHLKVCARVIAHHHRKDEATQLRPAFVGGGGSTICNTAWGEPNTTVDISDEAFEFVPPSCNDHDGKPMPFMRGNNQNVSPADMANLSLGRVSKLAQNPGHSHGNTHAHSPYPQLPEQFGSYNCLRCSRGYTNWVDCVAHMVGCCNQVYENGKLWGGLEAVRMRCGMEEPSSKKCTQCGSFKSKHDFESTEWAEIGKADRIRQCKDCYGR